MEQVVVQDPFVLVLVDGDSPGAISHAKGHLFEQFTANFLHAMGYEKPNTLSLNVTSAGVEIDVSVAHEMDATRALVECKSYTSPVKSEQLSAFYGKLSAARLDDPSLRGFFVAIPRLTSDGHELADKIAKKDNAFRLLTAIDLWEMLQKRGEIVVPDTTGSLVSDSALVIHASGLYAACLEIDPTTKTASRVLVRAVTGGVSTDAMTLLGESSYAQGLPVHDTSTAAATKEVSRPNSFVEPTIVEVSGSGSDFEYQLPAAPKFFVGRRNALRDVKERLSDSTRLLVLNAQSGWGKSSLALKIAAQAKSLGGLALVFDARTASAAAYVPAALRRAGESAESVGLLTLKPTATWASLTGALKSIEEAEWKAGSGRLVIFFDQFENVFRDEELTRQFRDLALLALDSQSPLLIGFAWKTDYVGWTENHPYRLRDEIRNSASLLALEPFGAGDVDTILNRLQKEVGSKLSREIRQRLREYSQGLPWLLKKLSGHLIQEFKAGKTQEQLVAEALNVANLFESDLAHLSPAERETLAFVARYAPIQAGEVTERFNAAVVQSLLDQRLIVQVGEKLDTYWDTFRDYLNTGRAPIEDSYILRQTPGSVARLLAAVISNGGEISVSELTQSWHTSENVVWNVARELRQLGLAQYKPNQIQLVPEIMEALDQEGEVRRRVAQSLRRHRAYTAFVELSERGQGAVTTPQFARQLAIVFPAVEVAASTWSTYARVFLAWFEYAGLITIDPSEAYIAPDGTIGKGFLTISSSGPKANSPFPSAPPGPSLELLISLAERPRALSDFADRGSRRALSQLLALGAAIVTDDQVEAIDGLVVDSKIVKPRLAALLGEVPGGGVAMAFLQESPAATPLSVGEIVRSAYKATWADSTVSGVGKAFRGWARSAGLPLVRPTRVSRS